MENKTHYIVSCTNENPIYHTFVPTVYQMWKILIPECKFILGYVGNKEKDDPFVKRLSEFCDELHCFKLIPGVTEGCQAKTTRMYLATLYNTNVCSILDIDQYVLNVKWFLDKIKPSFTEKKFVAIGHNHYYGTPDNGKFPMAYSSAPSDIWKKIINPKNLSYTSWFEYISNLPNPIDNKENPKNVFNRFSDESLLRYLLERHEDREFIKNVLIKIEREDVPPRQHFCTRRVDRGWWNKLDLNLLKQNYYIDSNPLRPFNSNFNHIAPILQYLKIKGNKKDLFF